MEHPLRIMVWMAQVFLFVYICNLGPVALIVIMVFWQRSNRKVLVSRTGFDVSFCFCCRSVQEDGFARQRTLAGWSLSTVEVFGMISKSRQSDD